MIISLRLHSYNFSMFLKSKHNNLFAGMDLGYLIWLDLWIWKYGRASQCKMSLLMLRSQKVKRMWQLFDFNKSPSSGPSMAHQSDGISVHRLWAACESLKINYKKLYSAIDCDQQILLFCLTLKMTTTIDAPQWLTLQSYSFASIFWTWLWWLPLSRRRSKIRSKLNFYRISGNHRSRDLSNFFLSRFCTYFSLPK